MAVGKGNYSGALVVGIFRGFYGSLAVTWEGYCNKNVPFANVHNLLENFACAGGCDVSYVIENFVKIEAQEACKGSGTSYAKDINMSCIYYGIRNLVEFLAGSIFKSSADFFYIHVKNLGKNVRVAHTVACDFDSLDGCKAVADHFLKRMLKFRIAVVTKFGSKADYR